MSEIKSPSVYVRAGHGEDSEPKHAAAHEALERFRAALPGIKPYSGRGRWCLVKLERPNHRCSPSCYVRVRERLLDHSRLHIEFWRRGRQWVVTGHPYNNHDAEEFIARWQGKGVKAGVFSPSESWYFNGVTRLVVLEGVR